MGRGGGITKLHLLSSATGKEEKVGSVGAAALHAMLGTCDCCFLTLLFLFSAQTDNPASEEAET